MDCTPKAEIFDRISCFQKKLISNNIDGAIIILNSDMFYFAGTVQNSFLYIPAENDPVLMVKRSLRRGIEESPLKNIVPIAHPKQIPEILSEFGYTGFKKIGLELDVLPVNIYKMYKQIFPETEIVDISNYIKELRSIKSPYEIGLLKNALVVIDKAFSEVPFFLHEGMTEIELASLFEAAMRRRGYSGCCRMRAFNQEFFYGNLCSGDSGYFSGFFDGPVAGPGVSVTHPQGAGWKRIRRNEIVYIDYTCVISGYAGDQTRQFCMGRLTSKMEKAYEDAVFIQSEIVKSIKAGTPAEEPYFMAVKLAEEMGYKDNFMGYKDDKVKFVGHGIGLELDEWPVLAKGFKMPIMPGMAFALEPKFIFPEGVVGTENSFIMTENGPEEISITPEKITYLE